MSNLGKAIKLVRVARNLRQGDLAAKAGISVAYVSLIERDLRDVPFSLVLVIAKALNINAVLLAFLAESEAAKAKMPQLLQERLAAEAMRSLKV